MGDITFTNSDTAETHHITHKKGDSFERRFIYSTCDDNGENCTDDDITLDIFRAHVRHNGRLILSFELGKGLTITPPNILLFSKTAAQMNSVEPGTYTWDLERKFALTGLTETEFKGNFIINADSTY